MNKLNLKSLNLQNFATFKQQSITFDDTFNALIGETGSGKSLILDAIQIILGFRADKKFIRKDAEFASIEAIFQSEDPQIKQFFDGQGYPFDAEEIVLKRIIYKNDSSKSYVNFQACNASLLNNFARRFIDIVGQFENQKLLSESYQLILLDQYCGNQDLLTHYKENYEERIQLQKKLDEFLKNREQASGRLDYLNFQIEEIEKINPSEERERELLEFKSKFQNKDKRQKALEELAHYLDDSETSPSILNKLDLCLAIVHKNREILNGLNLDFVETAAIQLKEIANDLSLALVNQDEEIDIESILNELDQYQKLKRKFGGSVEAINETYQKLLVERDQLQNLSNTSDEIEKQITRIESTLTKLAQSLSEKRLQSASTLSDLLTTNIQQLNMKGAIAQISVTTLTDFGPQGKDRVSFIVQTNPGEGFYAIKDVASGGELSRILLALRKILSSTDSISIFLFDEIDTGIGGETAITIGKALEDVSKNSQVIAITHLPQIANFAEKLISVSKDMVDSRTESVVLEVKGKEKKKQIQQMAAIGH